MTNDEYSTLITAMRANGQEAGTNAAGWWYQDTLGGRASGDVSEHARTTLTGLRDGDPVVMDSLPWSDLSGEWADGDTAKSVYGDASGADWPEWETLAGEVQAELADAWCDAYGEALVSTVERYCISVNIDVSNGFWSERNDLRPWPWTTRSVRKVDSHIESKETER